MNTQFQITQASINDLEELVAIFDQYRIFYNQAADPEGASQFLFERFEHQESIIFIARDIQTGRAVGFTQLYPVFSSISMKRSWILNDLYVIEEYRKRGGATQLLNSAKEFAILTRAKGIELSTSHLNLSAQSLYESIGYKKDDEYFHYYLTI
ncbi:GNAT family N-acetyltransferase [Paenibacillus antibioticophila]|uniref:GNAT family N-acetyltransferase n=1 Tax=Paenibacillus antibioticophila TaxID=1274374 RepID=UPI0005C9E042|nr:GNAT family N-acetyltransferase [Paenibacillus antibioticophila]